ncbi:MAG: right-handed parallel beta-helix repeat-containing protein [Clostridia bacterium]|nr:right-handed parallel beta-helix repeat-containing protein [Clostridia bacterium]
MSKSGSKSRLIICILCVILAAATAAVSIFIIRPYYYENNFFAPIPALDTGWSNEPEPIFSDFYVSANASPDGNGTQEKPFATIEQAKAAVRKMRKEQISHAVIAIMAGTYDISSIEFTEKDSGTEICPVIYSAYGDGEVIFDGGVKPGNAVNPDNKAIIDINGAEYITFSSITFRNTSGCAIRAIGNNINISFCTVQNTGGNGIEINGMSINVNNCQISNTGACAIKINGGNRDTLEHGNCSVDNNLIASTSKFDATAPSVIIEGTGNSLTHNEIINSPAAAVYYSGNANKIEYNYIHNTCYEGTQLSAIDSPMRWDCYGNFVRYNLISTIGNGVDPVTGVKACSGTEVRGNMFINIKGVAMDFNGGRDINFTNNIIHNCTTPIVYQTAQTGADDPAWKALAESPYKSENWKKAYPNCSAIKTDYSAMTDPLFAANPANSVIKDNVILQAKAQIGEISNEADTMSNIGANMLLKLNETKIFIDAKAGNYRIDESSKVLIELPDFRNIPFDSIGRY